MSRLLAVATEIHGAVEAESLGDTGGRHWSNAPHPMPPVITVAVNQVPPDPMVAPEAAGVKVIFSVFT
ncbi:hypothetical protein [Sphaerisporangium corydalis]|uniref:Uncharacterized protein n=1 Tax=Sphaerisporangium corydalis TaxID=1441875 RepID=A0ABV9EKG9_9ACTN|nr:hypothetical protein [Sphaerisporangium corydalis]